MAAPETAIGTLDTLRRADMPPEAWERVWEALAKASGPFLEGHKAAVESDAATLFLLKWPGSRGRGGFFLVSLAGLEGAADLVVLAATGRGLVCRESADLIRQLARDNGAWRVVATIRDGRLARKLAGVGFTVRCWGHEFLVEASAS